MAPDHIKDPALREKYQNAIAANNKKAETFRTQSALRRTRETFLRVMENYLVTSYSRPPANVNELEASLSRYSIDQTTTDRILKRIKDLN